MVTPNSRRDRGQVILIGAITLAFILLGIVVVFNGVLYTETISESSTSQSTADAEVVGQNLEQSLVEIARQGNENGNWTSSNTFEDAVMNSGEFNDQYQNVAANSRSAFVNVSNVTAEYGHFTTEKGKIYTGNSKIQHLVLDLDTGSGGTLNVVANSTDDNSTSVSIVSDGSSFNVNSCDINENDARFNIVNGTIDNSSAVGCDSDDLQSNLSIINTSKSYNDIHLSGDLDTYEAITVTSGDSPDVSYGVWKLGANITYQSNQVSYKRRMSTILIDGDSE